MSRNKYRVEPNKEYKITLGVNQAEQVNKAANKVDETPNQFIRNATIQAAKKLDFSLEKDI